MYEILWYLNNRLMRLLFVKSFIGFNFEIDFFIYIFLWVCCFRILKVRIFYRLGGREVIDSWGGYKWFLKRFIVVKISCVFVDKEMINYDVLSRELEMFIFCGCEFLVWYMNFFFIVECLFNENVNCFCVLFSVI